MLWTYENHNSELVTVDNTKLHLECVQYIYEILLKCVEIRPEISVDPRSSIDDYMSVFNRLFSQYSKLEERIDSWQNSLSKGDFGFKKELSYNSKKWFKDAVEVTECNWSEIYTRKEAFIHSNWKKFQDALKIHKHYVHIELLPKYRIYV